MDLLTVISVVFLMVMACALVVFVRMGVRVLRGHEEAEAGGSFGTQLLGGRRKHKDGNA